MMVVGLTGGIGSGKSTVAKLFGVLGVPVYNTDARAKEMYYKPEIKQQIIDLIGKDAYDKKGKLNPAHVSKMVFGDASLLQKLNSIIHPVVGNDFKEFIDANSSYKLIVKESALLFETGIYKKMDKNILVTAPIELRVKRVTDRDRSEPADIMKRIGHQMPDEEKIPISDFVIQNDEVNALIPQVLEIYNKLNAQ